MKVIELLNKIANGEEVPKKIKYDGVIYNWDILGYLHYRDALPERAFLEGLRIDMVLNTYVEVIEDEEIDIETINAYKLMEAPYMASCLRGNQFDTFAELLKQSELEMVEKINKLVEAVKYLNKKIKEKE